MKKVELFKPSIAVLQELAAKYRGMTITDEDSYKQAKEARKELGSYRIGLKKFGKAKRQEFLEKQRWIIKEEKERLEIIAEVEEDLKTKIKEVDDKKKREERKVLLPTRLAMLKEIKLKMIEDEILDMDEKEFGEFYAEKKTEFIEEQERIKREKELEKQRKKEMEQAKKEAAEKAKKEAEERAEREKQEEIERIKREQEERKQQEEQAKREQAQKEAGLKRTKKIKEWAERNGVTQDNKDEYKMTREGSKMILYKKISELTI